MAPVNEIGNGNQATSLQAEKSDSPIDSSIWFDSGDPQAVYAEVVWHPVSLTDQLRFGPTFSLTAYKEDAAAALGTSFALELNDNHELYSRFLVGASSLKEGSGSATAIAGHYYAPWGYERPYLNIEGQSLLADGTLSHYLGSYFYFPIPGTDSVSVFGGVYRALTDKSTEGVAGLSGSL